LKASAVLQSPHTFVLFPFCNCSNSSVGTPAFFFYYFFSSCQIDVWLRHRLCADADPGALLTRLSSNDLRLTRCSPAVDLEWSPLTLRCTHSLSLTLSLTHTLTPTRTKGKSWVRTSHLFVSS